MVKIQEDSFYQDTTDEARRWCCTFWLKILDHDNSKARWVRHADSWEEEHFNRGDRWEGDRNDWVCNDWFPALWLQNTPSEFGKTFWRACAWFILVIHWSWDQRSREEEDRVVSQDTKKQHNGSRSVRSWIRAE